MRVAPKDRGARRLAALALALCAVIHLIIVPEHLREIPYLAVLFSIVAGIGAVLALRLWIGDDEPTWHIGAAFTLSLSSAYLLSRTAGLPGQAVEAWDGWGISALVVQAGFLICYRRQLLALPAAIRRGVFLAPLAILSFANGAPVLAWGGSTPTYMTPQAPFQLPLVTPPLLKPDSSDATTDYYTLNEKPATATLIPNYSTPVWTYNGITPGPTIKATSGRGVLVHVTNGLPENTNLHNHGAHTSPTNDGGPIDPILPGATRDYFYPNNQTARTQWYHDHGMGTTGPHVYKGLAGMYLISDNNEIADNLPKGADDVPLVIQDRNFNTDGTLAYTLDDTAKRDGLLGNTILVNGHQQPYFQVPNHKVRFRVLNGSNARVYDLALSNGQPMTQIGNEGGLLSSPVQRSDIPLQAAERVDIVVDFSKVPVGTSVVLNNGTGSSYSYSASSTGQIMRFDVVAGAADTSTVPSVLAPPVNRVDPATSSLTRNFKISQTNGNWTFNGLPYDPNRVDATPALGATETWHFDNRSGITHPIHIHDINFQILDINGQPPPVQDAGWKEVVNVPAWGSATVISKFVDFTGTYVFHCHILEHEDFALMSNLKVGP